MQFYKQTFSYGVTFPLNIISLQQLAFRQFCSYKTFLQLLFEHVAL